MFVRYQCSKFIHYSFIHFSFMYHYCCIISTIYNVFNEVFKNIKANWRMGIWLHEFLISVPKEWKSSASRLVSITSSETIRRSFAQEAQFYVDMVWKWWKSESSLHLITIETQKYEVQGSHCANDWDNRANLFLIVCQATYNILLCEF